LRGAFGLKGLGILLFVTFVFNGLLWLREYLNTFSSTPVLHQFHTVVLVSTVAVAKGRVVDMQKTIISIAVLTLLSGCAFINQEQYSKKAIEAVVQSEDNIIKRIDNIDANLHAQTLHIEGLEAKIVKLSRGIKQLKKSRGNNAKTSSTETLGIRPFVNGGGSVTALPGVTGLTEPVDGTLQSRAEIVILGSLERIYIDSVASFFVARVDTGATTSAINAVDMAYFERDGKKWIKFHVSDEQTAPENQLWLEAPITRYVKIRQSGYSELERRPVVELWVKVGNIHEKTQFTLSNRTKMDYPILLGREFIKDRALVDVSRDYIESKKPKIDSKTSI
jgi:hypothetical protein